jgi:cell division ATPase FtsA
LLKEYVVSALLCAKTIFLQQSRRIAPYMGLARPVDMPRFLASVGPIQEEPQMARKITAKQPFKSQPTRGESKAQVTDRAFREIVKAETKARNRKTAKLRQARLKQHKETVCQ